MMASSETFDQIQLSRHTVAIVRENGEKWPDCVINLITYQVLMRLSTLLVMARLHDSPRFALSLFESPSN